MEKKKKKNFVQLQMANHQEEPSLDWKQITIKLCVSLATQVPEYFDEKLFAFDTNEVATVLCWSKDYCQT